MHSALSPELLVRIARKKPRVIDPVTGIDALGKHSGKVFNPWSIILAKRFFGKARIDLGYAQAIDVIPPEHSIYKPFAFKISVPESRFDKYYVKYPERDDWYKQLVDNVRTVNNIKEDVEILTKDGVLLRDIPIEMAFKQQDYLELVAKRLNAIPEPYAHSNKAFEKPNSHEKNERDEMTTAGHRLVDNVLETAKDHATIEQIPLKKVLGTPEMLTKFIVAALHDDSIKKILVKANFTTGNLSVLVGKIGDSIAESNLAAERHYGVTMEDMPQSIGCPYCNKTVVQPPSPYYLDNSQPIGCPYCNQQVQPDDLPIGSKYKSKYSSSSNSESDSDGDDQYSTDDSSDNSSEQQIRPNPIGYAPVSEPLTDVQRVAFIGHRMKSGITPFLNSFAESCNSAKTTLKRSMVNLGGFGMISAKIKSKTKTKSKKTSDDEGSSSSEDGDTLYSREYRPYNPRELDRSLESMVKRKKSHKKRKNSSDSEDEDYHRGGFSSGGLVPGNSRIETHLNPNRIAVNWIQEPKPSHGCSNFIRILERNPHAEGALRSVMTRDKHLILFALSDVKMSRVLSDSMVNGWGMDAMEQFIKQHMVNTSQDPREVFDGASPHEFVSMAGKKYAVSSGIGGKLIKSPSYDKSKLLGFGTIRRGRNRLYVVVF